MTQTEIIPQEPGAISGVDQSKLEAIAAGTAGDVAEALDGLSVDELDQLRSIELSAKSRKTVLAAIDGEIDGRTEDAPVIVTPYSLAVHPYANKRAEDVDRNTITDRVLTLDGWVLPAKNNLE